MKVLLVQPAPFEPGRLGLENVVWFSEPVALTQLAAMLPEHEVRILDMRLEDDLALNQTLLEFRPDLVGTTSMTTDCYQAKAILQIAKSTLGQDCFTIVGGHHPTLSPEDFEEDIVNSLCIGEGEDSFRELVEHLDAGGDRHALDHIAGLRYQTGDGRFVTTAKRSQNRDLDSFPAPARDLVRKYAQEYFFTFAGPMASMSTSRGCSFDCNFCAIWEFYERKTRFLSAKVIVDRMEAMEEDFVFFLDDNFLTNKERLAQLADELERRKVRRFWGSQGRTDFIADNPDIMKRLRDAGLIMILSGYESNEEDGLAELLKRNTVEKNKRAAEICRELGIFSTGIFMVRQDFTDEHFDRLYEHINELGVALPLVTVLTPLPGTQLYKAREHELLTKDARLFDLLHSVLPTKMPRERFYQRLTEWSQATWPAFQKGAWAVIRRRPRFLVKGWRSIFRCLRRAQNYRPISENAASYLRDEIGVIDVGSGIERPVAENVVPIERSPVPAPSPLPGVRAAAERSA